MDKIKKLVDEIISIASKEGKTSVFLIGNTKKEEDIDFYTIPIRSYSQIVATGAIVFGEKIAKDINLLSIILMSLIFDSSINLEISLEAFFS